MTEQDVQISFLRDGPSQVLLRVQQRGSLEINVTLTNAALRGLVLLGAEIVEERLRYDLHRLEESTAKITKVQNDGK